MINISKKSNLSPSGQFAEKLKNQGHKCVCVIKLKSGQNKVQWCGQISCVKNLYLIQKLSNK